MTGSFRFNRVGADTRMDCSDGLDRVLDSCDTSRTVTGDLDRVVLLDNGWATDFLSMLDWRTGLMDDVIDFMTGLLDLDKVDLLIDSLIDLLTGLIDKVDFLATALSICGRTRAAAVGLESGLMDVLADRVD